MEQQQQCHYSPYAIPQITSKELKKQYKIILKTIEGLIVEHNTIALKKILIPPIVKEFDAKGNRLLARTLENGNCAVLDVMLQAGVSLETPIHEEYNALQYAIMESCCETPSWEPIAMELILKLVSRPEITETIVTNVIPYAMRKAPSVIKALFNSGKVNVTAPTTAPNSIWVAVHDQFFCEQYEHLSQWNWELRTPMCCAAVYGTDAIFDLFFNSVSEDALIRCNDPYPNPLFCAVLIGNSRKVNMLANAVAIETCCNGKTPLHVAVRRPTFEVAQMLLDRGANPNSLGLICRPPLVDMVIYHNMMETPDRITMLKKFISMGANVDIAIEFLKKVNYIPDVGIDSGSMHYPKDIKACLRIAIETLKIL